MAHNILSYGSPEAARRANRAINKIAQDGGFVGVKPTERRVHTAVASQGGAAVEYNGYFKIVDSSFYTDEDVPRRVNCIKIVDGASYKEGDQTSEMICMGNGARYVLPMYEKTNITTDITFYIKMTRVNESDSIYKCSIVNDKETPIIRDEDNSFYQIGRVVFERDSFNIVQDHVTGVPMIYLVDEASFNTMLCTVQGNHSSSFPIKVTAEVNGVNKGYFDLFASELSLIGAFIPSGTRLIGHKTLVQATEGELL